MDTCDECMSSVRCHIFSGVERGMYTDPEEF